MFRKSPYFILFLVLFNSVYGSELGIGFVVPNIGYKATLIGPNHMLDYSVSYSSNAFAFEGPTPDRVVNQTLFVHFITNARTEKWSPIFGIGGIYTSYVKEYDSVNEEGKVFALGVALGTYRKITPNLCFYSELNFGYAISSHINTDNPLVEIEIIPFVPKLGLMYTISY